MKKSIFGLVTAVLVAAFGLAHAQEPTTPSAADMAAMWEKWQKTTIPGEHHKHLDAFVGKWRTTTKIWMGGPGSPPEETPGESSVSWALDGRFIMEEHKGTMMGQPYSGIGMTGYDNYQNMYIGTWAGNQSTSLITMRGMREPTGKKWTFFGEMDEPMLDVYGRTIKYAIDVIDADTRVFSVYDMHAGDDYKVFEITYKRVK